MLEQPYYLAAIHPIIYPTYDRHNEYLYTPREPRQSTNVFLVIVNDHAFNVMC